jgi:hypothetical protein
MINKMAIRVRATLVRNLVGALMMLAASAQFRVALAEEAESSMKPEPASKRAEPSQTDADKPQQPATKVAKTPDEFTPSEEISEDFAVSFPVDI